MVSEHTPTPWKDGKPVYPFFTPQDRRHGLACVNAFHSPDGREIPTEAITEGLFWEVVEALKDARAMMDDRVEDWEVREIRNLLAKLEPQK